VAKGHTKATQWLPGVNALGSYGRGAFAEFRSAHELGADLDALPKAHALTSSAISSSA
jgi:type III restriction enzyme